MKGPNERQHLYSSIFEKEEDCKNNPFIFEKFNLAQRKREYPSKKIEGPLFKKGKVSEFELKERYFIFYEHSIVSFKVRTFPLTLRT